MLKRILAVALIAAGCITAAQAQTYHHYECTDGAHFEVAFYPETKAAFLQIDGKSMVLPKRFSLISQRFKQSGYSFAMRARRQGDHEAWRQDFAVRDEVEPFNVIPGRRHQRVYARLRRASTPGAESRARFRMLPWIPDRRCAASGMTWCITSAVRG